jgi:hypothetical protein
MTSSFTRINLPELKTSSSTEIVAQMRAGLTLVERGQLTLLRRLPGSGVGRFRLVGGNFN